MKHKEPRTPDKIPRMRLGALWLALALTAVSVSAQAPSPSPPAQPPKTGKISGRVVNEKGQPLPNARVVFRAVGPNMSNPSVFTDHDGKFEISGLDRLNYQVSAWASAYAPLPRKPGESQSNNYRVGDSVTLVLTRGGVITGTVTNQDGEPLVGIRVRAKMIRDRDLLPWSYGPAERSTDDRGVYRIYGLPAGTYVVSAGGSGPGSNMDPFDSDVPTYSPSSSRDTAAEITVSAGEEARNIDIRYRAERGHIVSGTASGPVDQQIGFTIELTSVRDGEARWTSSTTAEGREGRGFAFEGVDDGDYYVIARSFFPNQELALSVSKRITVRGADVTGLELLTQPLGSVTGRVVLQESSAPECADKERPVFSETLVSAWHKETEATRDMPRIIWSLGAPVNPDAEGNVKIRNLAPGEYRFVTQFAGKYWFLQSISLASKTKPVDATRTWTTIKSGDRISGLTVTLAQGAASLRGQIAAGEGETLPERLFVYLVPAEREKADEVLRYFAARVTSDGKIALNNLAPGRYWILAQPSNDDLQSPATKVRLPDATEVRSMLRRAAEAAKNEIEFKPCQQVADFRLKL